MRLASVGLLLLVAGCFAPKYGNGDLQCGANGACPSGFHCGVNNYCYKPGGDPDLAVPLDLSADDLAPAPGDDGSSPAPDGGVVRHQGQPCGPSDICDTGHCVDGYCCDSPCANTCQACNVPNNLGICTNVGIGVVPVGGRSCNAQAPSTCGRDGTCDGAGNCRNWPPGTHCSAGTCNPASDDFTNPSTCNGSGSCVANGGGNCAPYKCQDTTQCYGSCISSDQCSGANTCINQSCGKLPNGRACNPALGGAQCQSGNCVDGYCCNSSCTSSCQACDVGGSVGTCTTVGAGPPHGTRSCTNQGMSPCGGMCNGTTASCSYAPSSTACGATCVSGQLQKSFCDGNGACAATAPVTCAGNYVCPSGASACSTTCNGNNDCFPITSYGCSSAKQCKNFCVFDSDTFDDGCIFK